MSNKIAKPMANKIVVDDGSKVYTIENKRGKVLGKFEFRPTDTNIVKRYEEVVEYYNSYQLPENPSDADMRKAEDDITERISYLIGEDAKETFFSILTSKFGDPLPFLLRTFAIASASLQHPCNGQPVY